MAETGGLEVGPGRRLRLAALADGHGWLPPVPRCDVLVVAGDFQCHHDPARAAAWFDTRVRAWLAKTGLPADRVVYVPGNHDRVFAEHPGLVAGLPWTVLADAGATVAGLAVWGTPWTLRYGKYAFMGDDPGLAAPFALIPDGLDVLVSHGPPRGVLDRTADGLDVGGESLLAAVRRVRPRLHLFGHVHEGRGLAAGAYGPGTLAANVAAVDTGHNPAGPPVVFERNDDLSWEAV